MDKEVLTKELKVKIIKEIKRLLKERYIYPVITEKINQQIDSNLTSGVYDNIDNLTNFTLNLDKILQEISKDKHLHVIYDLEHLERLLDQNNGRNEENSLDYLNKLRLGKSSNFGFEKVEILPGNIGLLKLNRFFHPKIKGAAEAATSSMKFLRNAAAIIIDLQDNGGGEPGMVQLLSSYFFRDRTRLNSMERPYEGFVEQYWTYSYSPEKNHVDKLLYILTSENTFSAAEGFTYALQCQKRATIVGKTTKGGAHPVDFFPVLETLILVMPYARAFNTITNDNWEGKGVKPNVETSSEDAFGTAYCLVLEKLIFLNQADETEVAFLKLALKEHLSRTQKKPLMYNFDKIIGTYGNARVELIKDELHYIIEGVCDLKLIPLSDELFQPEGSETERILFEYIPETNDMKRYWFYKSYREVFTSIKT